MTGYTNCNYHNMTDEEQDQQRKAILQAEFIKELRELMAKHHVTEITAEDHYPGYAECGEDIYMTATIHRKDEYLYHEFSLGQGFYQEP